MLNKKHTIFYFLIMVLPLLFSSCKDDEQLSSTEQLNGIMNHWYLWEEHIPHNATPSNFQTPEALMEAMRYKAKDKWSSVGDLQEYLSYYEKGQTSTYNYGFYPSFNKERKLFVRYIYKETDAYKNGIRRGDQISKIDGQVINSENIDYLNAVFFKNQLGESHSFTILTPDNTEKVISLSKAEPVINPVLHSEVISLPESSKKVGYLVFKSFIELAENDLKEAFQTFQSENIDDLVLDLRYNGGGRVHIAETLAAMIAPESTFDKPFIKYMHNDLRKEEEDITKNLEKVDISLDMQRLFVLTTDGTASASELIIHCLSPYMEVHTIGQNSYGKPVGAYPFQDEANNKVYSVIGFSIANANDEANYFDGLPVSYNAADGIEYRWGDTEEPMLKGALDYIKNGSFGLPSAARIASPQVIKANEALREDLEYDIKMGSFMIE